MCREDFVGEVALGGLFFLDIVICCERCAVGAIVAGAEGGPVHEEAEDAHLAGLADAVAAPDGLGFYEGVPVGGHEIDVAEFLKVESLARGLDLKDEYVALAHLLGALGHGCAAINDLYSEWASVCCRQQLPGKMGTGPEMSPEFAKCGEPRAQIVQRRMHDSDRDIGPGINLIPLPPAPCTCNRKDIDVGALPDQFVDLSPDECLVKVRETGYEAGEFDFCQGWLPAF